MRMTIAGDRGAAALWIVLIATASVVTTLALACATPFTALAALAATQLRARDGIALTGLAWAASQAVGFCLLDYPRDAGTLLWGGALGTAALAATIAARAADARIGLRHDPARIALAFMAATIAFKLVILLWSFGLGGVATALSPAINARQFVRNGAILIALVALYNGLVRAGLPAAPCARTRIAASC